MAPTADDSQEEHGAKEVERSFWATFTRADMRLFLVTFAGTVTANIVTVMVVALALIASRPPSGQQGANAGGVVILVIFSVLGLASVIVSVAALRRNRSKHTMDLTTKVILAALAVSLGVLALLSLLILLGWAAGVK
jgi:hypothetical protein